MLKPIPIVANGAMPYQENLSGNNVYALMTLPLSVCKTRMVEFPYFVRGVYNAWQTYDIPPVNYGKNLLQTNKQSIKVIDFYVDSVSLADITPNTLITGDGSVENPFKNFYYALYVLLCYYNTNIAYMCNTYVYIHIKGVMDYGNDDILQAVKKIDKDLLWSGAMPYANQNNFEFFLEYLHGYDNAMAHAFLLDFQDCTVEITKVDNLSFSLYAYAIINLNGNFSASRIGLYSTYLIDSRLDITNAMQGIDIQSMQNDSYGYRGYIYHSYVSIDNSVANCFTDVIESEFIANNSDVRIKSDVANELTYCYDSSFAVHGESYLALNVSYNTLFDCVFTGMVSDGFGVIADNLITSEIRIANGTLSCIATNSQIQINNGLFYVTGDGVFNGNTCNVSSTETRDAALSIPVGVSASTANNTFTVQASYQPRYDSDIPLAIYGYGIASGTYHSSDNFSLNAEWSGYADNNSYLAIVLYNDCGGNTTNNPTLNNCTSTFLYNLPNIYEHFTAEGLTNDECFNIIGGSIFKGLCIDGQLEKDRVAECKQNCEDSGHTDCVERCKSFCEQYNYEIN